MISAQLKNTPTAPANDVCVDQFQVVPTPLFKQDKRHTKAAGNQYVNKDLISFYRPLVKNIVNRMMVRLPSHVDAEDLYSVGLMALITASKRYTHQTAIPLRPMSKPASVAPSMMSFAGSIAFPARLAQKSASSRIPPTNSNKNSDGLPRTTKFAKHSS
jgi:hypothetical protein